MTRKFRQSDPTDNDEEQQDEVILVSKSELKRDMVLLHDLGTYLVNLKPHILQTFDLPDLLRQAISDAQRFKMEARRRQMQYIGKLMRKCDSESIQAQVDKYLNINGEQTARLHKIEQARDRILTAGDDAISELVNKYETLDRSQLRQLYRQASKESQLNKPPRAAREIFQLLNSVFPK